MNLRKALTFVFSIPLVFITIEPAFAADMNIVDLLTTKLGVTKEQAEGGAGAIFKRAKSNLSAKDFGKVANVVPQMDTLLKAAPEIEKSEGLAGGALGKLGGLSSLSSSFSKLGLSPDMIGKFTPIILSYVQSEGGNSIKDLLSKAVK
jgi:hypothetical protein